MPLPKTDNGRIQWSINFEAEFPPIGRDFGFSADEIADIVNDSGWMRFVIQNGQKARANSKASNTFKYDLLGSSKDGRDEPELPAYTPLAAPPAARPRGILARFSKFEERLRAHPAFSDAVGDLLQINSAKGESLKPGEAKPSGKGTVLADSVVRIDWTKGKFDGVEVEGQRGDETDWTKLERDFRSPFDDERPPLVAGKPEERRYRLRYLLDDKPVGDWSDVIVVITKP